MKLVVGKNQLGGQIMHRSPDPSKNGVKLKLMKLQMVVKITPMGQEIMDFYTTKS